MAINIEAYLRTNGKVVTRLTQQLTIFHKDLTSISDSCEDIRTGRNLDMNDVLNDTDGSIYGLDVLEENEVIEFMIPRGAKCILRKPDDPNMDCEVEYKNIRIQLLFEDEDLSTFFELIEED